MKKLFTFQNRHVSVQRYLFLILLLSTFKIYGEFEFKIYAPQQDQVIQDTLKTTFKVVSANELVSLQLMIDTFSIQPILSSTGEFNGSIDLSHMPQGPKTLLIIAKDITGFIDTASLNFIFQASTVPVLTVIEPHNYDVTFTNKIHFVIDAKNNDTANISITINPLYTSKRCIYFTSNYIDTFIDMDFLELNNNNNNIDVMRW